MTGPTADQPLPPNDLAAERALLGACLLAPRALDDAVEQLSPEDFYRPAHGELLDAMITMRDKGEQVDPLTLAAHLGDRLTRLGGAPYLHDLMAAVPVATNAGYYAEIVLGKALRRRLVEAGQRAIQLAHGEGEPAEVVERARATFDAVAAHARGDVAANEIGDLAAAALDRYTDPAPPSVPTMSADLNAVMSGGLRPGTLTIVGSRPGVGKSLLGSCLALHAAQCGHGTLIVSLEMTEAELTDRIIANLGSVHLASLVEHRLSDAEWGAVEFAAHRLHGLPLAVVDQPHLGLTGIRSLARDRLRTPRGLGLLVIDYLGLMRPADARVDRQEQVAAMSRGLKLLAKELHVPVVALHQLNRQVESRGDRRPVLSDLRESGALEQDADGVWLLYRPTGDDPRAGEFDVIVAKNRQGPTTTVTLAVAPHYARVTSLSRAEPDMTSAFHA